MLECLLKLRSDANNKIGIAGPSKRYSIFLRISNQDKFSETPYNQADRIHFINVSHAVSVILTALKYETGNNDFLFFLEGGGCMRSTL